MEVDVTTLIGLLTAVAGVVGSAIGALWKASQRAQARVIEQIEDELRLERSESTRLHGELAKLQEKRVEETRGLMREHIDAVSAMREANEESASASVATAAALKEMRAELNASREALDAMRAMIRGSIGRPP